MGWKSRKTRPLTSSKSTSDILKALRWPGRDSNREQEEEEEEGSYFRQGYLHVQADDGFWFMMWVVLRGTDLELYNDPFEHLPVDVVNLVNARLVIPPVIPSECPENIIYPIQIVKEDCPNVACFAAKSPEEQEEWADAFRSTLQACSLTLEGLDLQCLPTKHSDVSVSDHETLMRKMELLEELLAQRDKCVSGDQPKSMKTMELCQKLADADNYYDRVIINEQQDALRRATYLRQRKISTQLKADTIRKQLSKNNKRRSRPKSLHELSEDSEFYEGQLQELTNKLKAIHSVLGKTEKESEAASRKLGRKYEHEMKRLHSDMDLGGTMRRLDQSQQQQQQQQHSKGQRTWSLSKSQEDCRNVHKALEGSDRRGKESPLMKNKNAKITSQNPLLAPFQQRRRKTSDESEYRSSLEHPGPSSINNNNSNNNKSHSRISPLRLLGHFVDSQLLRGRNKSKKYQTDVPPTPVNEFQDKPRSKTENDLDLIKPDPDYSIWNTQFQSPTFQRLEGVSSGSDCSARSSLGNDSMRTKIDPNALAEIEAFESMTQQFLHVAL